MWNYTNLCLLLHGAASLLRTILDVSTVGWERWKYQEGTIQKNVTNRSAAFNLKSIHILEGVDFYSSDSE